MPKYSWTTGPVHSSLGYDSTFIVLSNNSSKTQKVQVKFYDLGFTPKKLIISKNITLSPDRIRTLDTRRPEVKDWEVQIKANSKNVRTWIGGRRLNYNLPGNTVLSSELVWCKD